ncbi:ATP-binding protein [Butyricimonas paravirosa]|uniref:ATP-binding protein n=1 Tax=Butyricimonas paravirosa TaxID=1472417 RepID=UPI0022DFC4E8|nr:ATP-binding protein [Butyricimonas paravirosa]
MIDQLIYRSLATEMKRLFEHFPVITLTGPRQSGKTTLCRKLYPDLPYINLENANTLQEIQDDIKSFFDKYSQGVIIDEAHNFPEIFSYIQIHVDEDKFKGKKDRKFIVTGSSNFALLEKVTQSMAGRTAVLTLLPLSYKELLQSGLAPTTNRFIINGGYPAIWLDESVRTEIYSNYYTTYIERDVRSIINIKDLRAFHIFLRLCAGRIGSEFNASSLSVATGVSVNTINSWISVLAASYTVYLLTPYHANIGKRLTKTPKIYFYDTGLAAYLLGIENEVHLQTHPLRGELFENMVINEILKEGYNKGKEEHLYFYRDKTQREIDVIRMKALNIEAYEIKAGKSYDKDYFKHLKYLKELLGEQVTRTTVLYDGDSNNDSTINGLYNFRDFSLYDNKLV